MNCYDNYDLYVNCHDNYDLYMNCYDNYDLYMNCYDRAQHNSATLAYILVYTIK